MTEQPRPTGSRWPGDQKWSSMIEPEVAVTLDSYIPKHDWDVYFKDWRTKVITKNEGTLLNPCEVTYHCLVKGLKKIQMKSHNYDFYPKAPRLPREYRWLRNMESDDWRELDGYIRRRCSDVWTREHKPKKEFAERMLMNIKIPVVDSPSNPTPKENQ